MRNELRENGAAARFYDARYSGHYMEEWSAEAKDRIVETVTALELGTTGEAIDFGCGRGILTDVLRRALGPGWTVTGTDFSAVALESARARFAECEFLSPEELKISGRRFDLVFSHHVLEHVPDLDATVLEIVSLARPAAAMIHILPCGNEGSFEHKLAMLRTDGVDSKVGNRFFFEDEGHLRRLRSDELAAMFARSEFRLEQAFFRNQHFGAIDWITQSGPAVIRTIARTSAAVDGKARKQLRRLRFGLLSWWLLRFPAAFTETHSHRERKSPLERILMPVGLLLYPFSKPVDRFMRLRATREWRERRLDPRGSEMFLLFRRGPIKSTGNRQL
jgi:2-polyprenyl-3-methyl-5-hydroxy-6-metoxy-1,4-benzoquinol methylase